MLVWTEEGKQVFEASRREHAPLHKSHWHHALSDDCPCAANGSPDKRSCAFVRCSAAR